MDIEPREPKEGMDAQHGLDDWNPWNLPRAVAVRNLVDEWPEPELVFQERLAPVEGKPAA